MLMRDHPCVDTRVGPEQCGEVGHSDQDDVKRLRLLYEVVAQHAKRFQALDAQVAGLVDHENANACGEEARCQVPNEIVAETRTNRSITEWRSRLCDKSTDRLAFIP